VLISVLFDAFPVRHGSEFPDYRFGGRGLKSPSGITAPLPGPQSRFLFSVTIYRRVSTIKGLFYEVEVGRIELPSQNIFSADTTSLDERYCRLPDNFSSKNPAAAITMAGGTFATGGHNDVVGVLTLQGNAALDMGGAGYNSVLAFASSSGVTWSGTLTITNYLDSADTLYVGTTTNGLTSTQLSRIVWDNPYGNGTDYTGAIIDFDDRVHPQPVPEPKTVFAIFLLFGVIAWRERKLIGKLVKRFSPKCTP
jgi:hypothetical protein